MYALKLYSRICRKIYVCTYTYKFIHPRRIGNPQNVIRVFIIILVYFSRHWTSRELSRICIYFRHSMLVHHRLPYPWRDNWCINWVLLTVQIRTLLCYILYSNTMRKSSHICFRKATHNTTHVDCWFISDQHSNVEYNTIWLMFHVCVWKCMIYGHFLCCADANTAYKIFSSGWQSRWRMYIHNMPKLVFNIFMNANQIMFTNFVFVQHTFVVVHTPCGFSHSLSSSQESMHQLGNFCENPNEFWIYSE